MQWLRRKIFEWKLRQQLTPFQKAELAYQFYFEKETKKARERMLKGIKVEQSRRVSDILANKVGISPSTFERAKVILENGSENLKEKVRTGRLPIKTAYDQIKEE